MEEQRQCSACNTILAGPFEPKMTLSQAPPNEESDEDGLELQATSWVCVSCGLVHWFAEGDGLKQLQDSAVLDEPQAPQPASSYERRAQVLRMLRRVRRM
jgi:hypothetical protein